MGLHDSLYNTLYTATWGDLSLEYVALPYLAVNTPSWEGVGWGIGQAKAYKV